MADENGLWAYAVTGAAPGSVPGGLAGVGERPVETVTAAGLTAAVSRVSLAEYGEQALRASLEDLAWLEQTAWAHHHVIETLARETSVVPLRLATVYRDGERVAEMLAQRQPDLRAALARVAGRAEWGVKVYAVPGPATSAVPAESEPESPGAAYLRRRKSALSASDQARRAAATSAHGIHAALAGLAAAAALRPPQGPQLTGQASQAGPMILNGAYLVDIDLAQRWSAAVAELAGQHPAVRVELTGPWPPYSFAALEEDEPAGRAPRDEGAAV